MDLQTFVSATLIEIANGVHEANASMRTTLSSIEGRRLADQPVFMLLPSASRNDQSIEFDVAVTASAKGEAKADGKGRLFVADASASAAGSIGHERVSRVRFRVQVQQSVY